MNVTKYALAGIAIATMTACGGGGSGGSANIRPDETAMTGDPTEMGAPPQTCPPGQSGTPPNCVTPQTQALTEWMRNPTAADLMDHWGRGENLAERLELDPMDADASGRRRAVIRTLIERAQDEESGAGTLLRNVEDEHIHVLGQRDGITYARWTAGPADTLNIEFDWRFAEAADDRTRAMMERAGKAWSHRIRDDFPARTLEVGTHGSAQVGRPETFVIDEAVIVDDILIMVMHAGPSQTGASSADTTKRVTEDDNYEPWVGRINLSYNQRYNSYVMMHEVGHIVMLPGFFGGYIPSAARYVNTTDATFEGPEATKANAGEPVPFLWVNEHGGGVPAGTPGARPNYAHFECVSAVTYCGQASPRKPTDVDVGVLADIGYDVIDAETAGMSEIYGYGAWGRFSAWGVGVERELDTVTGEDRLRAGADAFGTAPVQPLAQANLVGTATWRGALLGVDTAQAMLPPVTGRAELTIDLDTLAGRAAFDELSVTVDGETSAFRSPELRYAVNVEGNAFSDDDARVNGGFFGPEHEEMAGIVTDQRPGVALHAAFGGTRAE